MPHIISLGPNASDTIAPTILELVIDGELDAAAVLALRGSVIDATVDRSVVAIVDISTVTRITPSAVAGMLDLLRVTRPRGGDFRIYGNSRVLHNAYKALSLSAVIRIYGSRAAALVGPN